MMIFRQPQIPAPAIGLIAANRKRITENWSKNRSFTLVELMVVVAIIAILMVLVAPAFTNLKSAGDVASAAYGIKDLLDNARSYAKANNTYVFVGLAEVDASVSASDSPQITTGATPYGRVAVAIVASKDGTRQCQYAITNQGSDWTSNYANGSNLTAIGKLQVF